MLMQLCSHNYPDIHIGRGLSNSANPAGDFFLHTHTNAELFYFLRGKASFFVEGNEYVLEPGDLVLLSPGESHFLNPDLSHECDRVVITFDLSLFRSLDPEGTLVRPYLDRKAGQRNRYRLSDFRTATCKGFLGRMIDTESDRLTLLGNLMLLLREIGEVFCRMDPESGETDSLEYRIIRYINQNLDQPLHLQQLCRQFFISRSQLCVSFKRTTGTSVGKYITIKRLFAARQRILLGEKPTEVYQAYGYQEYTTFYRAYLRNFGHSPKKDQERQNYRSAFSGEDAEVRRHKACAP